MTLIGIRIRCTTIHYSYHFFRESMMTRHTTRLHTTKTHIEEKQRSRAYSQHTYGTYFTDAHIRGGGDAAKREREKKESQRSNETEEGKYRARLNSTLQFIFLSSCATIAEDSARSVRALRTPNHPSSLTSLQLDPLPEEPIHPPLSNPPQHAFKFARAFRQV